MSSLNLWVSDDLRLPASKTENPTDEAVVVSLTAENLYVGSNVILTFNRKTGFAKRDLASDERAILKLKELLDQEVLIQADKDLPFGLIKYMLHTVAQAGYTDYKFIAQPTK